LIQEKDMLKYIFMKSGVATTTTNSWEYLLSDILQIHFKFFIKLIKNENPSYQFLHHCRFGTLFIYISQERPKFSSAKVCYSNTYFWRKTFTVRAYENIIYVANPVDTVYQKMNIYIPEEYFSGKK
jgi:hypothetical protein